MRKEQGTLIIPVVLRPCAWLDVKDIKPILAATKDGLPISKFSNADDAWMDVYDNVKRAVTTYKKLKDAKFTKAFDDFLDDATVLTKAHSMKNVLKLSDIFIYPEMTIIDEKDNDKKISSDKVILNFTIDSRIAIVGDDQSGKTALLKVYVRVLKSRGFLPVYVKDPQLLLQGNLEYRINNLIKEQYTDNNGSQDFNRQIIVPLIDDFHKTKDKEKISN